MKRENIKNPAKLAGKEVTAAKIKVELEEKDFQLDDREKELIHSLFSWTEQSKKKNWVLGQPL